VQRFRMVAYYEDATNSARVAQTVVVIERDVPSAVKAVKETLAPRALDGHIIAVELKERDNVQTGVVFIGEPYIPLHWPLTNRPRAKTKRSATRMLPPVPSSAAFDGDLEAPLLPWSEDDPPETI